MGKFDWLPAPIREPLIRARNDQRISRKKKELARLGAGSSPKRIIVGSAGLDYPGWVATDKETLDLLSEETWSSVFQPDSLDAILAEHVWEHLTPEEAVLAARICFRFLKPGCYLRAAVPDGLHPDPSYIELVKPGGSGPGADDHKVLYRYDSFKNVFGAAGFDVHLYEYFDEKKNFHYEEWRPEDGFIERSKRFDSRNSGGTLAYTSIILDAKKPNF